MPITLKTYKEVWNEKKQSLVITYVVWVLVFFFIMMALSFAPIVYNFLFALLASLMLILCTIHFQRYSV